MTATAKPKTLVVVVPTMMFGGAETQVLHLMRNLDPKRWRPVLVALHEEGPLYEQAVASGIESHSLDSRSRSHLGALIPLAGILRQSTADAVLLRGFSATTVGRVAALLAGTPVRVLAEHSSSDIVARGPFKRVVDRILAVTTTAWISVTAAQTEYLVGSKSVDPRRLHVVPNGIDFTEMRYGRRPEGRSALGLADTAFVVGTVSALRREKAVAQTLLPAFRMVADRIDEAHLVIVGDGPESGEIRACSAALGLDDRVTFTGARSDVGSLLAAFDVFALGSDTEAAPLAIVEAMGAGLPIVATCVGGIPSMVDDGVEGTLVAPGDPTELASAIAALAADRDRLARFADAALLRAQADFDVRVMAGAHMDLLDHLVGAREGGGR